MTAQTTTPTVPFDSAPSGLFLGVCTDRSDGEVRFVVTGTSIAEIKANMDATLEAACALEEGATFDPFEWRKSQPRGGVVREWAINATDDFAQIVVLP